jgi:hypothetical protein
MPESVLYKSSSLIVYSSGLSRSLKQGSTVSSQPDGDENGDHDSPARKRQRIQASLSNKEICQAYRDRKKGSAAKDPKAEFTAW